MNQSNLRKDIHRPSVIEPKDYMFVACELIEGCLSGDISALQFIAEERKRIRDHMQSTGGNYSNHRHGGNCMVCGSANAIYTILFYHQPSNTYVRMGQDCARKCEIGYDNQKLNLFKTACKEALALQTGKKKAQALLEQKEISAAYLVYEKKQEKNYLENTITDIVSSVIRYGNLTEKQENYLRSLLNQLPVFDEKMRRRTEEKQQAKEVPITNDRIEITGEILSKKVIENQFGFRTVITVKTIDGWIAWGTCPPIEVGRGCKISFVAGIQASESDKKFGFFSRPKNARIIE
jgi:hypothetical protein